jgi:iron(III) transport system permease protein
VSSRPDRSLLAPVAVGLAALGALPVAAVIVLGFAAGGGDAWSHLLATVLPGFVANTLLLVVLVGAGVAFGGTLAAWLVSHRRFPGDRFFAWALLLPLAMPAYVMAYAYTDWLEYAGPVQTALRETFGWSRGDYWFPDVRSLPGAAAMFVATLYPYVYLLARTAFLERPPTLVEAARSLGLDARRVFWRVDLPLARPAIAGGIALALMETLADYGTVAYFAVDTFTTGIYRAWFALGDRVAAAQLSSALLAFVVGAVLLEQWSRGATRVAGGARQRPPFAPPRPRLTGLRAWGATALCTFPIVVGFALPIALLLRLALGDADAARSLQFTELAWNSFRVAALAALLATAFAIVVAYTARLAPGRLTRGAGRVLALGYAVPGTVLAVGVLLPVGAVDAWLATFLQRHFAIAPSLLLTGTIAALLYAYLVRYFAVAWNGVEPAFARITPNMDAAARGLGAGTAGTLLRVHAPLLARSAAAAVLLVFVDVMKELPATLLMRPFNFDTLATRAYTLAKDERLAEAALPALAIVAVGVLPLLLLAGAVRRGGAVRRAAVTGALAPGGSAPPA